MFRPFSWARRLGLLLAGRRVLLLAGVVFAALPAGSALADTTVGQTGTPVYTVGFTHSELAIDDMAMPTAGVVTSIQTQSSSCNLGTGVIDFQVLRPMGDGYYRVLGETGNHTDPCDSQLHSYPVNIPVQPNDVLGVYVVFGDWQGVLDPFSARVNFFNHAFISEPSVGATVRLSSEFPDAFAFDESATLVPTSALAATLVGDATSVGPGASLSGQATAILTAVNSGDTATACAAITDFLAHVKAQTGAQTGKKLTSTQASQLTADANNLAAALGC